MAAESGVVGKILTPAIGGAGFFYIQEVTVEYSSNATITMSTLAADANNGSYGSADVTLPTTGGAIAKTKFLVGANKGKLFWFQFASVDPSFRIYTEGFSVRCKNWGSRQAYKSMNPFQAINEAFPDKGGFGGQS